jgi:hypothetical protein
MNLKFEEADEVLYFSDGNYEYRRFGAECWEEHTMGGWEEMFGGHENKVEELEAAYQKLNRSRYKSKCHQKVAG